MSRNYNSSFRAKPNTTPPPATPPATPVTTERDWLLNHLPNCAKDISDSKSMKLCLQDIDKLSCKDIKNFVTVIKNDPLYSINKDHLKDVLDGLIDDINKNKDIIESIVNTTSLTSGKINCFLKEVNNQILTDDSKKFDLLENDKLRDMVITNLGGCTKLCQRAYSIIIYIFAILFILFLTLYLTK
jgi:hypothetical protein